jgi:hypothetical protein
MVRENTGVKGPSSLDAELLIGHPESITDQRSACGCLAVGWGAFYAACAA